MLGICLTIAVAGTACGAQGQSSSSDGDPSIAEPSSADPRTSDTNGRPPNEADFDPANFSHPTQVTNPYFPMQPGTQLVWKGHAFDDGQKVSRTLEFTVTDLTKTIGGVRTVVARDRDFTGGKPDEVELTFYAQDDFGTVWYFGEYSEEYDDNKIVKSPLWLAGLRGARAGIMMPAEPRAKTPDYAEGWGGSDLRWNDRAKVRDTGVETCVATGCYRDVAVIEEFNPDEPGQHQLKYFAPGVGGVRTGWGGANETEREELTLVSRRSLDPHALADLRQDALDEEKRAYQRSPGTYGQTARMEKA